MPEGFPIQTNFTAGEVSPYLRGRTDFKGYFNGVETLKNFVVLPQGGAMRRSGTRFIAEVKDSTKAVILKRFEFSANDAFILEFGEGYIRFFKNAAPVLSGGAPYEIATPYTEANLKEMKFAQSADVLYIAHKSHQPRKLSRLADTNWTLQTLNTKDGPYLDTDTSDTTMYLQNITDRATVTSTNNDFVVGDVGKFVEFVYEGYLILGEIKAYVDAKTVTVEPKENVISNDSIDGTAVITYAAASGGLPNRLRATVSIWSVKTQYSYIKVDTTWYYLGENIAASEEIGEVAGPPKRPAYTVDIIAVSSQPTMVATTGKLTFSNRLTTATLKASQNTFSNARDIGRLIRLSLKNNQVAAKITAYTSATEVSVTLEGAVPKDVNDPSKYVSNAETLNWKFGAWYVNNWPYAVLFHEGRLVFLGTDLQPQTLWMSKSQDFENFAPTESDSGVVDDNAITQTLNSGKINKLIWGVTGPVLLLGTFGSEWQVKADSINEALSPTNFNAKEQTAWGSEDIAPERIGVSVLYVQRSGTVVRELVYSYEIDSHVSNSLNLVSEHILRESLGATDIAYQKAPYSRVWIATNSGRLVCLTFEKEQEIVAWSKHEIGGSFAGGIASVESVECVPDSSADKLYLVAKRTINGATKRYVEMMENDFWPTSNQDKNNMFYLDSYKAYDFGAGPYSTTITGLAHLEGQTVKILVNGSRRPDAVVNAGQITINGTSGQYVRVGLKYQSLLKPMPIEAGSLNGTAQGKTKRIHKLVFRLVNSLGMKFGVTEASARDVSFRETSGPMDQSPDLFTGDKEITLDSGYDLTAQYVVIQEEPYPLLIAAIMPQLSTS
jgi:hypothetical protein